MEVTASNFEDILTTLPAVFNDAQFLTFDTEFTGLNGEGDKYNYYDTLPDWYASCRSRATKFLAIQYGICAFKYDAELNKYTYKAFNFYVFPSTPKRNFSCQVSCLRFLADHHLDFNKLFKDGIPYLTQAELEAELIKLKARQDKKVQEIDSPSPRLREEHKKLLDNVMERIADFLSSDEEKRQLPRYNSFIRRLIYQKGREKYGENIVLETCKDETMLLLKGMTAEAKKKRDEERWESEREEIDRQVGFSKVIKLIIESGKPLIGHNMTIDLLFTINQFLQPLSSYEDFLEMTHHLFPHIYDTKYLAYKSDMKISTETTLSGIIENSALDEGTTTEPIPGFGYNADDQRLHEAGYDAYLTGLAFIALVGRIGKLNLTNVYKILPTSPLLQPLKNKLSVPRLHDIQCMDIEGPGLPPDRRNVFHITFPETWKKEEIVNHFKDFGFINISWIDTSSAYVGVGKDVVKRLRKTLMKNKNGDCKIQSYHTFKNLLKSNNEEISNQSRKRISSEDLGEAIAPSAPKKQFEFNVPAFE